MKILKVKDGVDLKEFEKFEFLSTSFSKYWDVYYDKCLLSSIIIHTLHDFLGYKLLEIYTFQKEYLNYNEFVSVHEAINNKIEELKNAGLIEVKEINCYIEYSEISSHK